MRKLCVIAGVVVFSCATAFAQPGEGRPPEGRPPEGGRGFEGGRGGRGGFPNPIFDAIDTNKDGTISAQELDGAAAALKTLDKDGDGKITREEVRPQFGVFGRGEGGGSGREGGGPPTPESFVNGMMERDANKDGKLSAEELGERGARMLAANDTNGDKQLDREELMKAAASMMERFRGGRSGGGRPDGEGGNRPEGGRPQRPQAEGGDRI
ncbi:MAG: EF-hand domain-containing protein [Planctomycetaceae bacterium]